MNPGKITAVGDRPVVDLTGLKGSYDFEFTWSGPVEFGTPRPPCANRAGGEQLGLKLSVEKHTMPIVVIDHADRLPADR